MTTSNSGPIEKLAQIFFTICGDIDIVLYEDRIGLFRDMPQIVIKEEDMNKNLGLEFIKLKNIADVMFNRFDEIGPPWMRRRKYYEFRGGDDLNSQYRLFAMRQVFCGMVA